MHYYSFNIADYKKDTAHLKPMEHYIYRTLIDLYYLDESPIPIKTHVVMRRLSLETQDQEKMLLDVLNDFFEEREDGFYHKRISGEIEKYHDQAEKNRKNGKKGGRPPKNKPKITQVVSDGLPVESQINPNQEPITNNQEPITTINNNSNNPVEYSVIDSVADWNHPDLSEINGMIVMGSPPAPALNLEQYQYQLTRFKNFYTEKEIQGSYIRTEARRKDMLADWIKRDYQKNKPKNHGGSYENSKNSNGPTANTQGQTFDTRTTAGYSAQLDAEAAAYFASRDAEQTGY